MGPLKEDTFDELSVLTSKIDDEILATETKLKRTAASWKGRATRAQRKAEDKPARALRNMKAARDQAIATVDRAPALMKQEFLARQETLNRPVREAMERLLAAEQAIPVPHPQAVVDDAQRVVDTAFENLKIPEDIARQHERYRDYLRQIDEINQRRGPEGGLSRVDQRKLGALTEAADGLRDILRRRGGAAREDPYRTAVDRLQELTSRAAGGTPPPEPGTVRLYRGEALAPEPGPGLPDWMAGQPELVARDAVEGRWYHSSIDVAKTYPTNRDPGVGNRIRYVDVPEADLARYQQLDDATKALSA